MDRLGSSLMLRGFQMMQRQNDSGAAPGAQQATIKVKGVWLERDKLSKKGKPYDRFAVRDEKGVFYSTFTIPAHAEDIMKGDSLQIEFEKGRQEGQMALKRILYIDRPEGAAEMPQPQESFNVEENFRNAEALVEKRHPDLDYSLYGAVVAEIMRENHSLYQSRRISDMDERKLAMDERKMKAYGKT